MSDYAKLVERLDKFYATDKCMNTERWETIGEAATAIRALTAARDAAVAERDEARKRVEHLQGTIDALLAGANENNDIFADINKALDAAGISWDEQLGTYAAHIQKLATARDAALAASRAKEGK